MGETAQEQATPDETVVPVPHEAAGPHPDDLIDDRALINEEDDEFRLRDIVDEVARLCEAVPVPATVALYGSWGAGKSSLASLLRRRFIRNRVIAFARFDAFKYAETPLRRHFISQLAGAFNMRDSAFSEGLYTTNRDFRLRIPPAKWWKLIVFVLVALTVVAVITALASLIYAGLAQGSFHRHFVNGLRFGVPGAAFAVPLLAAAIGLLGNYFTAETTVEAPSSDEQFERVFRKLVKKVKDKKKCERIVVFIDELDRCSPSQVVSALETLRTFLEIRPCIFIVAADQQVLERALTEAARQATPFNASNPYYSAGSAYLDKIFQYQLALPPILPRRLSRFALELIQQRNGVWAEVDNRADLVSVLVPTHVSSPRRVKALLNAFALLYRLALRRAAERAIDENIRERADEVAKLTCLRTEFPLFAADLQLDDRLPQLVLRLHEEPDEADEDVARDFVGLAPEALIRARAYAREELPVAEVIARGAGNRGAREEVAETEPDDEETAAKETSDASAAAVERVERSHARQLIRYLRRTESIDGPRRDLIYLESSGASFGLPPDLADQLERAAVDGLTDDVDTAFAGMSEEEGANALRLLARALFEAVGIEARNVAGSLFRAIGQYQGDLSSVAAELLDGLGRYLGDYELTSADLTGALRLSVADDGEAAKRMRAAVLARDECVEDDTLRLLVLGHAVALQDQTERLAEVLASALGSDAAEEVVEALADVPEARVGAILEAAQLEEGEQTAGLAEFARAAATERDDVARAAFGKLLTVNTEAADTSALSLLESFRPVDEPRLALAVIHAGLRRPLPEAPIWFGALAESVIPELADATWLSRLTQRVWNERFAPASGTAIDGEQFEAVAAEIGRFRVALGDKAVVTENLLEGQAAVIAPATVAAREEQYRGLEQLSTAGAIAWNEAASPILSDLANTLAAPQPGQTGAAAQISEYVLRNASKALELVDDDEAITEFRAAAEASPWLDATTRNVLRIRCSVARRRIGSTEDQPDSATLAELVAAGTEAADEALEQWVATFAPDPLELFTLLEPRMRAGARLPDHLNRAVRHASGRWSPVQKADVLKAVAPSFVGGELDEANLEAMALGEADADRATATLVEVYEASTNNEERRALMRLWQHVNPSPQEARRKLINRIYVPLIESGKVAADLALSHFALVRDAPTQAAQDRIKKALAEAAAGDESLAKRANRLMQDAGWIPKKARWLKRTLRRIPRP